MWTETFRRGHFEQVATGAAGSAGAAPRATGDINSPAMNEPAVDWPEPGQEMPEQTSGPRTLLMPGIDTFRLPAQLAPLWHDIQAQDKRKFLPNGQPNPTLGQMFKRRQLKFDRNTPLIVEGGPHNGEPMTATFSTHPRPRSLKKNAADDPTTPWISDISYLLDVSLGDHSRPSDPKVLEATVNKYGGKTIRLEHGLTAQCRPDKQRYIRVATAEGETDIPDPSGRKGCGRRYYTKDFKNAATGGYDKEMACVCGTPTPAEAEQGVQPAAVVIRAFESVDRFLPPL